MTIYYGKFLTADEVVIKGQIRYEYFNSIEAVYKYRDFLRTIGVSDVLEAVGEMEFAPTGHLVQKEGTEKKLYDYEEGNDISNHNIIEGNDDENDSEEDEDEE